MLGNTGAVARVTLSLSWGLLFGFFLSSHVYVKKIELNIYDYLIQKQELETSSDSIVLVKIREENLAPTKEKLTYANLVKRLLNSGSSVVVLNLHHNWRKSSTNDFLNFESDHNSLQNLVRKHYQQLVLVTPIKGKIEQEKRQFQVYNHLLVQDLETSISPQTVQGFFEYNLTDRFPTEISSTARQFHLQDQLIRNDNFETIDVESVAVLALKKHARFLNKPLTIDNQILLESETTKGIHFKENTIQFKTLNVEDICGNDKRKLCQLNSKSKEISSIKNKIVIVGFIQSNLLNTMPIQSPAGKSIPALEVQAYLLASLITDSFYSPLPGWLGVIFLVSGGTVISSAITLAMNPSASSFFRRCCWGIVIAIGASFGGFTVLLFSHKIIIPIMLPILTGLGCVSSALVCAWVQQQRERITQQQLKIERHIATEQRVALSQAQKILHRVADELHSGALQDLKLLMDDLELLQLDPSNVDIYLTLEKAEKIGVDLRLALYDTRRMADQLRISPELRQGLVIGIERKLQELQSEENGIYLKIIQNLQLLPEPKNNQEWIEAREDIFQFFKEAIANVIYHAQPPHGQATYLKVFLLWQEKCELVIENDGVKVSDVKSNQGYGTRLMATVANQLPNGYWERHILSGGIIQIKLVWKHQFENSKDTII